MKPQNIILILSFSLISFTSNGQKTQTSYYEGGEIKSAVWEYIEGNKAKVSNVKERDAQTGELTNYTADAGTFTQKVPHGKWTDYYKNGKIKNVFTFSNGFKNGPAKSYYDDGTLKAAYNYLDNGLAGDCQIQHPNGKLFQETVYIEKGIRSKTLIYDTDEQLTVEYSFDKVDVYKNIQLGHYTKYYPSKQKQEIGTFEVNISWKSIDETSYQPFKMLEKEKEYSETGQLIFDYNPISGDIISYYPNGVIHIEGNMLNGFYKEYYENGNLDNLVYVKNGSPHGSYEGYFESGQIEDKGEYNSKIINGELDFEKAGKWVTYFKNGKLKITENYLGKYLILKEYNDINQIVREYKTIYNPQKAILNAEINTMNAEKKLYSKQGNKSKEFELEIKLDKIRNGLSYIVDSIYVKLSYQNEILIKAKVTEIDEGPYSATEREYTVAEYTQMISNAEKKINEYIIKEQEYIKAIKREK